MDEGDVIARRMLEKDEEIFQVLIYRPERDDDGDYVCTWTLVNEASEVVVLGGMYGVDSIQALLGAIMFAGMHIEAESGEFTFLGMESIGFPRLIDPDHPGGPSWYIPETNPQQDHPS